MCWHPEFRNPAALPDVKVVRTSFFLNVCAFVITCALLIVFVSREYELRNIKEQVDSWETRIEERRPQSEEAVELSREFDAEREQFEQAAAFFRSPVVASELLGQLAGTLPERIVLTRITHRVEDGRRRLTLVGRVLGISEEATDIISGYEALFGEDEYFSAVVRDVDVTSVTRNPEADTLSFSFALSLSED